MSSGSASTIAGSRSSRFRNLQEIYRDVYENRQFNIAYFLMLVMASLIALLGLLDNSPAVIIGAMLISPLMGPILSCGLALTTADWLFAKKALRNLGLSVFETVLITALATWLIPLKAVTPEILARTNPNLIDLLIAMFSGFAGTLALGSRKGGLTIIPGVAIAVAVMPPLATIGYGVSTHQWQIAWGAFLLFFTNLIAIVISSNVVFFLIGFRALKEPATPGRHLLFRYRVPLAWLILIVLSIPLMQTLIGAAQQISLRSSVSDELKRHLGHDGNAQLASVDLQKAGKSLSVEAVVRTRVFIAPEEVEKMQAALSSSLGRPIHLRLEQVQLARNEPQVPQPHTEGKDYLASGVVRPLSSTSDSELPGALLADLQDRVEKMLAPIVAPMKVDPPAIKSFARTNDVITIEIVAAETAPTDTGAWEVAAAALSDRIHSPVHITGKLSLPSDSLTIQFRPRSSAISKPDLNRIRQIANSVASNSDTTFELTASANATPELTRERVASLRRALGNGSLAIMPTDPKLDPDEIQLSLVQTLNIASEVPAEQNAAAADSH